MQSSSAENGRTQFVNSNDPKLVLVKGSFRRGGEHLSEQEERDLAKDHVKKVALTIFTVIQKHGEAHIRCVGAASVSNAVKAAAIAVGEAAKKEIKLAIIPSFQSVSFDGSGDKTAIALKVVKI
jgi:stage V sporulation protein SpoVS